MPFLAHRLVADPSHPRGGSAFVELVRLSIVVLATAAAFELTRRVPPVQALFDGDGWLMAIVLLGSCLGYVTGGVFGRFMAGRIDAVERNLGDVSAGELLSAAIGALAGFVLTAGVSWPVLLFDGKHFTVPLVALVAVVLVSAGVRVGLSRGGDLLRFLGVSGRLPVASPASGPRAKVVDTSALVDGRLLEVCRAGFLEGALVLPRFVLFELQGLADAADVERRNRGRRGLDVLGGLQRSAGVALEVAERDYPEIQQVDAKLVALARDRKAALVTVDANLGRVAEVHGVKVLNLHALAETLRPPVLPGDLLTVRIVKDGREALQGVGYLADGTMVVVEGGRDAHGREVTAEVTSILSNSNGRMVFATLQAPTSATPRSRAGVS